MEYRTFGPGKVPLIGQGTWKLENHDRATAIAVLRRGIELGLTHIDTAELYGSGQVEEEIVSEAIRGVRDRLFIVSKVRPDNASYEGTIRACERSLRRLRTDHLDSYLLHWQGPHPLGGTIEAFQRLKTEGKIRSWGVSNFDIDELEEALAIAGEGEIACNQVLYHLHERSIEHELIPWCRRHNVLVVGYSPFGSGDFPDRESRDGRVLYRIAEQHGASPHQVALRFLLRDPQTVAIPKSSSIAHVEDNARAGGLTLSETDLRELEQAFPLPKHHGELPML